MDLFSDLVSSWSDYRESSRNDNETVIDNDGVSNATTDADYSVFALLEALSVAGLLGNAVFLFIIFRHKHHHKPSYILLASLACADIIHCLVMATYFYPPIVTKTNPFWRMTSRVIMSVEWAAWGVTLSHMLALSTDRFVAVSCCYRYPKIITPNRALWFVGIVWVTMTVIMNGILITGHCCLIVPAPSYYTFAFEKSPINSTLNIYQKIFVPCETLTSIAVGVITPMTLLKYCLLKQRVKQDRNGGHGGSSHTSRISLSKRESKVLLQIAVVTLCFFCYMINYYIFYYFVGLTSKWETLFNSLMYCFNSMVHPFIYFGFNRLLRKQLIDTGYAIICCQTQAAINSGRATPSGGQRGAASSPSTNWSHRFRARVSGWRHGDPMPLRRASSCRRHKVENSNLNLARRRNTSIYEMGPLNGVALEIRL